MLSRFEVPCGCRQLQLLSMPRETLIRSVDLHGFVPVERLIAEPIVDSLLLALAEIRHAGVSSRGGSVHAIRNLLEAVPEVQRLARSEPIRDIVEPVLGRGAFVVRGILFDKIPSANWKVSWHQDLTIAVGTPKSVPGFAAWSEKAGIPHVRPPMEVLERMCASSMMTIPGRIDAGHDGNWIVASR